MQSGVFLLNKPQGMSSNAALGRVKRAFQNKKGGHTGTLDPLASGLLPICLGEATKFCADLLNAPKAYVAHIQFGCATDSADKEGKIIFQQPCQFSREAIEQSLKTFLGKQWQIPPMFSALKYQGKPLYHFARQGIEVDRLARAVEFYTLDLEDFDACRQEARVFIFCSKGTYIRALARDWGEKLHSGAHLTALVRTQVGNLRLENAFDLKDLENAALPDLLPVDALVRNLPRAELNSEQSLRFCYGNAVLVQLPWAQGSLCRVYAGGDFLGTAVWKENALFPKRLLVFPRST